MNRGVDRHPIFVDDDDRRTFCRLLVEMSRRFEVEVHSYCLMDNHFHLLLRCPEAGISTALQWMSGVYAQAFNERHGRVGHLFGGRFVSRLLASHRYIVNVVRYIDRNPLDRPDVDAVEHYRWSSHRVYRGLRRADWLHTSDVTRWLGGRDGYVAFVSGSVASPPNAAATATPSADEIIDAVDLVIAECRLDIDGSVRSHRRAIALASSEPFPDELVRQVADRLGVPSSGALRTARVRANRLLTNDAVAPLMLDRVGRLLVGGGPDAVRAA